MIEIGSSLRDARLRRGLELRDVERETKIRRQQLEAPESERFEIFPAPAYARAFLREYAEFLGLDGQVYIDELDARFPAEEAPLIVGRPTALSPGRVPLPACPSRWARLRWRSACSRGMQAPGRRARRS